jgi:OmpA-OmpF porin, OOP family
VRSRIFLAAVIAASAIACNMHSHGKSARTPAPSPPEITNAPLVPVSQPKKEPEPLQAAPPAPPPPQEEADKLEIPGEIQFVSASAEIKSSESTEALTALAKVLRENPRITKLRIEGHTDDKGAVQMNMKLSKQRAQAVVRWLVAHGVEGKRLDSAGFGPNKPLAKNDSDENRAMNRRTEFHVVGVDGKPFTGNVETMLK